ncbi:hypothetical protein OS493_036403 [Desmophyllum pertusum]|uniref:Uncharacterized protein n=1 Tax=Desmophyllum pertusum TaxID=174260 RepID=A0A9W9ZJR2_9CNID|nr:hypothetical protein OS493_036403 [Desmophyllum pertusum]
MRERAGLAGKPAVFIRVATACLRVRTADDESDGEGDGADPGGRPTGGQPKAAEEKSRKRKRCQKGVFFGFFLRSGQEGSRSYAYAPLSPVLLPALRPGRDQPVADPMGA